MNKILIKSGVVFKEFNEYFFLFMVALRNAGNKFGHNYTVTSANDGTHCDDSYHYKDTGWDVRLKNLPSSHWYVLQKELKDNLPEYFDIIIENIDDPDNVHLHSEADLDKVNDIFMVSTK
jgi:hypothetical protein